MRRISIGLLLAMLAAPAFAQTAYRPITSYTVVATAASNFPNTRTLLTNIRLARAVCNVSCWVAFSASPVVFGTTVPTFLPANVPEYFKVTGGDVVSVTADSVTGRLYIVEME